MYPDSWPQEEAETRPPQGEDVEGEQVWGRHRGLLVLQCLQDIWRDGQGWGSLGIRAQRRHGKGEAQTDWLWGQRQANVLSPVILSQAWWA